MEKKIKKECLFEILLTKLKEMQHVTRVYIGKTNDIDKRAQEHEQKDGFAHTVEIAYGDPKVISEAEKILIKKFKDYKDIDEVSWKLSNKSDGGEGNSDASILYISYDYDCSTMKCDADVNDDELDIDSYELN